jgi:hypothetical protein
MEKRLTIKALCEADPSQLTEWQRRWQQYFLAHPEVLASWRYSNDYDPLED